MLRTLRGVRAAVVGLALMALTGSAALAGDAVVVLQETRTREIGKAKRVQHLALLKNTSPRAVHGLRVTVELYDHFGQLLWARTAVPAPSLLRPGDTATLSLTTPHFEGHRKTRYRFAYREQPSAR